MTSYLVRQGEQSPPKPLPSKIAPEFDQQTQAFSLSKTVENQTLYTVQAEQVTYLKDSGKALLRGVSIFLYGKQGQRQDRLWSQECEFDPAAATLWIPGKVEMELGIPAQEPPANPGPTSQSWVSVVTSGLSFEQHSGIASTESEVQFRFSEGQGSAHGAIYDPQQQLLTLPANVRLDLRDSAAPAELEQSAPEGRATETSVRAASLRFQRTEQVIYLGAPVEIAQGMRQLRAGNSQIVLDAQNRARTALLSGGVVATAKHPERSSEIRAGSGKMEFNERGKVKLLALENQAQWTSSSQDSEQEGKAGNVELFFDESTGLLDRIRSYNAVQMSLHDLSPPPSHSKSTPNRPNKPSMAKVTYQNLTAPEVDIFFRPDGKTFRQLSTQSSSKLELISSGETEDRWTIQGSDFRMDFDSQGVLSQFSAEKGVRTVAETPKTSRRVFTSQNLKAKYSPADGGWEQIEQWGKFRYEDADKQARAERAEYSTTGEAVVLQGDAMLWDSRGKLASEQIVWNDATGELTAEGHVSTTHLPVSSSVTNSSEPVHIVAERLQYTSGDGRAQYRGKVRLWQGTTLLESDRLELDQKQEQLSAQGNVYSVLQQVPKESRQQETLVIRSRSLLYWQKDLKAQYQGNVRMQSATANLTAAELEVFLQRGGADGERAEGVEQIKHAIARGDVQILEGARKASAAWAEYFPAPGELRLFGDPAIVEDPQRGSARGAQLTYRIGDDSMAVDGKPGLPAETRRQILR